jgi:hypothetical protein
MFDLRKLVVSAAALALLSVGAHADTTIQLPMTDGSTLDAQASRGKLEESLVFTATLTKKQTATIANGATTSDAIDLKTARLWAIRTPAALTGTAFTFTVSEDCSTYYALYDSTGTAVSWTVAASRYIINVSPTNWLSIRCFKIVSGSAEGAERSIIVESIN